MATKKSLLEPIEGEQFKTVSARIPLSLSQRFDDIVTRAKSHNMTISVSKVITHAIEEACKSAATELEALDKKNKAVSPAVVAAPKPIKCKCGVVMVEDVWKGGEHDGKPVIKCPVRNNDNKADHDFKLIEVA